MPEGNAFAPGLDAECRTGYDREKNSGRMLGLKKTGTLARDRTGRITLCGLLTAIMLILGFVESLIPFHFGVPGIKLGLSNGVLIFAVYMLGFPTALMLMAVKVFFSALLFGSLSMPLWFALAGGFVSVCLMGLLSLDRDLSPIVVSMAGGLAHNVGQVCICMLLVTRANMLFYMGILMLAGMLTGALTGLIADRVMLHMKALKIRGGRRA